MSSAAVAPRPSQALRLRRESQRPTLARTAKPGNMEEGAVKEDPRRFVTTQQDILAKFKGQPPSLRVYLYANHFRINDSQDSLGYASPMKELLQHIREKTVPHNMLDELYTLNVPFYDNCLIVEVHDHKSLGTEPKKDSSSSTDGGKTPFSIHNYNNFITPSPHVPYPQRTPKTEAAAKPVEAKDDKDVDKENMPAPGQTVTQKQPAKPKVITVVLFPTIQQQLTDMQLLATTPALDMQTFRRNQAAGRSAGNPPTPLTSVPPTPTLPPGRSPKRLKMVIDETNAYEFESALLEKTCPKLYLEPTKSLAESVALIDAVTHPNNKQPTPARKSRKRTTAELAADEAEAADTQRYMLAGDIDQASKTAAATGGEDGQHAARSTGDFSRFKTLEKIKINHEAAERRRKEEEALQAQAKRQAQAEQEAKKRREAAEQRSQAEHAATMMQQRQELLRQQQAQQAIQQDQLRQQQLANAAAQPTPQSATQPQFSSPVVRQQTPMTAAASPLVSAHANHPMGGTPMAATISSQGAGSPARPPSAVPTHPMARSASQQQPMSRTGTPQMVQGTPVMNSVGPARTMAATPQPRMNQGSPTMPMQGGTPMIMQTPQPAQSMTPEAMQHLAAQQQAQMQQRMRQQQIQNGMSPNNPQTLAMTRASHHITNNGIPQGQDPRQYKQMLVQRYFQQILQAQNQQVNMSPQNAGGMPGQQGGMNNGQGVGGMNNIANMNLQQLRTQYQQRRQQLMTQFGAVQNIPQQFQHSLQQLEMIIRQKEREMQAQMNQAQQGMGNMGMAGGGNPAQMQQYQQVLQQQRAQQARQQQLLAMQRQNGMNPGNMQQNMMGNMGMMNNMNMQNMQNMNMQNMGNMQNMAGMNMGNMGNMNMGQMNQMNQQAQMQMMLMRQAQANAQMRGQQQGQGGNGGMDWNG